MSVQFTEKLGRNWCQFNLAEKLVSVQFKEKLVSEEKLVSVHLREKLVSVQFKGEIGVSSI